MPLTAKGHDPGPVVDRNAEARVEVPPDLSRCDPRRAVVDMRPRGLNRLGPREAAVRRARPEQEGQRRERQRDNGASEKEKPFRADSQLRDPHHRWCNAAVGYALTEPVERSLR